MRFLHTADWQIGMRAAHVGEAGERVRDERLAAARRVIEAAKANGAEFIAVAGDVFEDNGVDRLLVQKVADIVGASSCPVFIIPGNHDPLVPGSVWEHPAWQSMPHVQVMTEEAPVEVPGGLLYPCPALEKQSNKNPTAWIEAGERESIRVGLAHGTVEGVNQEEPDYPIRRDAASRAALDYLALGHWHSFAAYPDSDGSTRMAYSGTHEPTKFGERDSGNALLVEVAAAGAQPMVRQVRTGRLAWRTIEQDVRGKGDLSRLRKTVEGMQNPAATLLDLRVSGVLAAEEQEEIERLQEILASRFLFFRLDTSSLRPAPGDEDWLMSLPAGAVREAAREIQQLADPSFQGSRPQGARPEVASRALLELYALVKGAEQ